MVAVLYFFEDGVGVEIHDADDHAVLHAVEVESAHLFFHVGDNVAFFVFQGQFDIGSLGSVSFFDVFFEGEDGDLRVDSEFGDFEGTEVMF